MTEPQGPTLESVSRAAGVSRQTVSNVLNAPDRVRPETRERVMAVIHAQGYQPNRVARSLRTRSSHLLGYCVVPQPPGSLNPVLDRFLHAVTTAAEEHGYHLLLFTAPPGDAGLGTYQELLAQRAVDGFLLSDTTVGDPRQEWLAQRGVPFAAFGRSWREPERGPWVDVDGAAGTAAATEHLVARGHRRIAFLGWPPGSGVGDDRRRGWTEACDRLGITRRPEADGENDTAVGRTLATYLLDLADAPTGIVCVSDLMAIGCLQAVRERGLRPGLDVGVVGFDDTPLAALPGTDLTSLDQPLERIGSDVVRLLLDSLTGDPRRNEHVLLRPTLVARASTGPPAA